MLFQDSNSGAAVKIPVTVYSNTYLPYTLSSVPTQEIEKYPTNFYDVNGLYEDGRATQMDIDVQNGCFVFETEHFSLYVLARFDFEGYDDPALFRANWAAPVFLGTGVALAALLVMAVLYPKWKKRRGQNQEQQK